MLERPREAGIDVERANAARMYDYYLGGSHNFAVDRDLADQVAAVHPGIVAGARGNRQFLVRAVRYCVEQGIRQFLDLGSGIPTADHVHTVARAIAPATRVAYVDFEPVAVAHSTELLTDVDGVTMTRADTRDPAGVLAAPTVTAVLDFDQPVAVLALALAHFFSEADDPEAIFAAYCAALVPGSYLVIAHGTDDLDDAELGAELADAAQRYATSATPAQLRDRTQIRALFGDHELVEPGLVDIARWRSGDLDAPELGSYCGIARL